MKKPKFLLFISLFLLNILTLSFDFNVINASSAPTIASISPAYGYEDLDTTITITGTGFTYGAEIYIGTTEISDVTVASSTSITTTVPYGLTSNKYDVKVVNPDTQYTVLTEGFQVKNALDEWTKENLNWTDTPTALTSTSTIIMPDGVTYRMYFTGSGGIWTATSTDGINWSGQINTGVTDVGATNPNVIRLNNETYLMIYGIQTNMPTTEILYRATSTDGINFTKQDIALTASEGEDNFVSVPDLIYSNETTLRMYFVASSINSRVHTATSIDNGQTWTREGEISITDGPTGGQINDPDIIKLSDGNYRLFFTTPPTNQSIGDLRMRSAISNEGRNFTLESGDKVAPSDSVSAIMDPDAILVIDTGVTSGACSWHEGVDYSAGADWDGSVICNDGWRNSSVSYYSISTADKYRIYYGGNLISNTADDLRSIYVQSPAISNDYASDGTWVNSSQTVTLTPTTYGDAVVSEIKYCTGSNCDPDSGTVLDSPYQLSYSSHQNTLVRYQVWDNLGNNSSISDFTVKIDKKKPTGSIKINNGNSSTTSKYVALYLSASDIGSGRNKMRFSNNGSKWTNWKTYASKFSNWNMTSSTYGGTTKKGTKKVYVQYKDKVANPSSYYSDTITYK